MAWFKLKPIEAWQFVAASHGQKVKKLPQRVKSAAKRGLVSESALKQVMGE